MHFIQSFGFIFAVLISTSPFIEGKRAWSSSSSKSKSRPTYSSRPSSYGQSNSEYTKLSYGGQSYSQPKPASNSAPIGWNVPSNKPQGPPPAYSASNPIGGAKASPYDKPPAYNPSYSAASSSNTNYKPSAAGVGAGAAGAHHGTAYRPKQNSTGGFGSGYHNRNSTGGFGGIQQSHISNQHSSYPTQQLPAGATYHQNVPAGATYYPSGGYHPQTGGGYYPPAGGLPAGASYHPAGSLPAGAQYYPSGYHPGGGGFAPPAGGSYYPAGGALPAGATYYNSPSALPAGASYYPEKSSGPGLGTGLIAGAIGGAVLGHVLTPTHTQTVQAAPVGGAASDDKDRIIIINNGQPASVTESKDGTTIINTNPAAPAAQPAPAPAQSAPVQPVMAPAAQPAPGAPQPDIGMAPLAPMLPVPNTNGTEGSAPLAPFAPGTENAQAAPGDQQPPAGGIICVPVLVNVTSPTDPNNVTQVEQIACYPAPPPEQQQPLANGSGVQPPPSQPQVNSGIPSTAVDQEKVSTAALPENSKLQKSGAGGVHHITNLISTTFFALILAHSFQN